MNVIILGPQGSGKGTQAEKLASIYGLFYMEVGAYLREVAKEDEKIDKMVNKEGVLVPDEVVFNIVTKYLDQHAPERDKIILDGYPRSVKQYLLIKEWLEEKKKKIDYAVFLEIDESTSVQRLSSRRVCSLCARVYNLVTNPPEKDNFCECGGRLFQREDDNPQAIKKRLREYRENTEPLLEILKKEGSLIRIDGERPIDEITLDIVSKLKIFQ
jgi:adenylate kinase